MKALFTKLFCVLAFTLAPLAATSVHAASEPHADEASTSAESGIVSDIAGKFGVDLPTLFAQMANFVIVAFALYFFAVKPIAATLDERQQKIAEGLQYAEEMKTQLAEAERERNETIKQAAAQAQAILSEAREQAKELIEQKTQEAAAQAEAILRKAAEASELERQKMLSEVRQEVARLVVVTSGKVLERELSDSEKSSYADSAAKELVNVS